MPSTSRKQQRFMGMTLAYKRGHKQKASAKVKKAARSMTEEQMRHFAEGRVKRSVGMMLKHR